MKLWNRPFSVLKNGRICSCVKHNKLVRGSDTSSHISTDTIKCTAVDIECTLSTQRFKILSGLIKAGFTRIGIGKTFIHADSDKNKAKEVVWLY